MGLGMPFQGTLVWKPETSYKIGGSGTGYLFSDKVLDAKIDFGKTYQELRGISSPSICGYVGTVSDYTIHVEWIAQSITNGSVVTQCLRKVSTGTMPSICIELGVNTVNTTKSYYYMKGCVCKQLNIKASSGGYYVYSADFSVASVTQGTTATLNNHAAYNGGYAAFNKAGHVIAKNTSTAIATIVDGIDVTINNNTTDYYGVSPWKQACIPGACDITGSVDISLDNGGKVFTDGLYTGLTNIYLNMNITTWGKWTFGTARWDGLVIDANTSNDMVKTNQKFIAKTVTVAT